jgi:hypothetical protein
MVLVSILMLTLEIHAASAATSGNVSSTSEMDWTPVMDAIIQVESKGDPKDAPTLILSPRNRHPPSY